MEQTSGCDCWKTKYSKQALLLKWQHIECKHFCLLFLCFQIPAHQEGPSQGQRDKRWSRRSCRWGCARRRTGTETFSEPADFFFSTAALPSRRASLQAHNLFQGFPSRTGHPPGCFLMMHRGGGTVNTVKCTFHCTVYHRTKSVDILSKIRYWGKTCTLHMGTRSNGF